MFAFDRIDARRIAVSAAGALVFSALCIGGAVAPAHAGVESPATIAAWQANSTHRIDTMTATLPANLRRFAVREARIDATLAADGQVQDARIGQSSGSRAVDAALLHRAATMKLAPLPASAAKTTQPIQLRVPLVEGSEHRLAAKPARYAAR